MRFFEEGSRPRVLFRRGQSTEGAFSKRAVDCGRFSKRMVYRNRVL